MITLKTTDELAIMRKASTIVAEILEELAAAVRPGVTTFELDKMAEELDYVPMPESVIKLIEKSWSADIKS